VSCLVQDTVVIYTDSELPGPGYMVNLIVLSCLVQDTVAIYSDSELPGSGYDSKSQWF
jgi:hypothetical protein